MNVSFLYNYCLIGSMPPHSTSIFEEGAVFKSFKLVENGVFQEEGKFRHRCLNIERTSILVLVESAEYAAMLLR